MARRTDDVADYSDWTRAKLIERLEALELAVAEHPSSDAAAGEESAFRQLIQGSPSSILISDGERIIFANAASAALFRAGAPERLIGVPVIDLVHPDERAAFELRRRRMVSQRAVLPFVQQRRLALDGTELIVETYGIPIVWEGRPAYMGLHNDISARLRADLENRRLATIVESSADAMIAISVDGIITNWNSGAERVYGYKAQEAIGNTLSIIVDSDFKKEIDENTRRLKRGERIGPHDCVRRRKDGSPIDISLSISPIKDEDGSILGLSSIHQDITDRKLAEQLLRESERRYRDLFEDAQLGMLITGGDGTRLFVNEALAELFGYHSADDLMASRPWIHTPPEDRERIRRFREAVFKGEAIPEVYEGNSLRKDGSVIPVQVFARRLVWDGQDAVHRTFIDLTERKRAEAALRDSEAQMRQAQKMEAVGQLTGGIAHEFNNLLMVIVGNLDMIAERTSDDFTQRFISSAMSGAMRGAELTAKLLAFSRKQELNVERVALNRLIDGMRDMLQRSLGETIVVENSLAEDLWSVHADAGQIESALLNLVLNARDAMEGAGRIVVATSNISLDARGVAMHPDVAAGDYVVFEVSDAGCGMAPEVVERAFDPFFTTKEVGEGTGLGLSMVHGFAEQSGGFVEIDSEVGCGTRVRIYLPRWAEPADRQQQDRLPVHGGSKMSGTVLVVEDDADVRDLVVKMLSELGCTTIEAEDGKAALARLDACADIDVLFTDLVLPNRISGLDIAREALRRRPGIKIILTSGYPDREIADLDGRSFRFIGKPYLTSDLAEIMAAVLGPTDTC